jgi:hypothetical protein
MSENIGEENEENSEGKAIKKEIKKITETNVQMKYE